MGLPSLKGAIHRFMMKLNLVLFGAAIILVAALNDEVSLYEQQAQLYDSSLGAPKGGSLYDQEDQLFVESLLDVPAAPVELAELVPEDSMVDAPAYTSSAPVDTAQNALNDMRRAKGADIP